MPSEGRPELIADGMSGDTHFPHGDFHIRESVSFTHKCCTLWQALRGGRRTLAPPRSPYDHLLQVHPRQFQPWFQPLLPNLPAVPHVSHDTHMPAWLEYFQIKQMPPLLAAARWHGNGFLTQLRSSRKTV